VDLAGERVEVDRWWGCRDHSWGVRPGVGGVDAPPRPAPGVAAAAAPPAPGTLFCFLFFSTPAHAGHVQIAERGVERVYQTGVIGERPVLGVDLVVEFLTGTRRFRSAQIDLRLGDASDLRLVVEAIGPSIAMPGLGYSGGWDDGLGLGVPRGAYAVEHDVWDVGHPTEVRHQDGRVTTPVHRIQPVRVTTAAGDVGTGSLTLLAIGRLPQHGLD
jgi:hypothetical protein